MAKVWRLCAGFCLLFAFVSASKARADALLIISSGGGLYGGFDQAVEDFGAQLVAETIGKHYRSVFISTDATPMLDDRRLKAIVNSLDRSEKLDVFSMKHSSESFLDRAPASRISMRDSIEKIFAPGTIRRIYSTGCYDGGNYASEFSEGNGDHFRKLGVQEYVLHANFNASGPHTLPALITAFGREFEEHGPENASWTRAAEKVSQDFDAFGEKILTHAPFFEKFIASLLEKPLGNLLYSSNRQFFSDHRMIWESFFVSRFVLGGASSDRSRLVRPTAGLGRAFSKLLPGVWSRSDADCPTCLSFPAANASIVRTMEQTAELGDAILGKYLEFFKEFARLQGQSYGPYHGCLSPKIINTMLRDLKAPQMESFCFRTYGEGRYAIEWRLAGVRTFKEFENPEFMPATGLALKSITLDRDGSVEVNLTRRNGFHVEFQGLGLNFTGVTMPSGGEIPDAILHFGLRSVGLDATQRFYAQIAAPILNARVGVEGTAAEAAVDTLRVLGIPIDLTIR